MTNHQAALVKVVSGLVETYKAAELERFADENGILIILGDVETEMPLVRLTANLNGETAQALKQLAEVSGDSISETLRRCIGTYKTVSDAQRAGKRVMIRDVDGQTESLELF